VRPEASAGFGLELLGDAFTSIAQGDVSRAKIEHA
jgi:hypothetical protein